MEIDPKFHLSGIEKAQRMHYIQRLILVSFLFAGVMVAQTTYTSDQQTIGQLALQVQGLKTRAQGPDSVPGTGTHSGPEASRLSQAVFRDEFNAGELDRMKWTTATYPSPNSKIGVNMGVYVSSALDFSQGMLRITVQQHRAVKGVESRGGAIISRERFGFGTYDFEMRMSSLSPTPHGSGKSLTGAISSGFIYYNKSESEIDLEFLGNENSLWISSWRNPEPAVDPTSRSKTSNKVVDGDLATRFRNYSMVWAPKTIDVYIDGLRVAHQTEHVPQSPAHIILQHRGTNSGKWGGAAAVGVERYFFVRSVMFTPRGAE
jgi:beta-glucanase (GH16 family)